MHSEWRIIPTRLNELQGTEVWALFLNAWKKESCNVYVLMTLLSRSARSVNVTNVNTTSCSSVVLLPCGKRVSFRQTRGWEQPKLARNEKFHCRGNHSCRTVKIYTIFPTLDCIILCLLFRKTHLTFRPTSQLQSRITIRIDPTKEIRLY